MQSDSSTNAATAKKCGGTSSSMHRSSRDAAKVATSSDVWQESLHGGQKGQQQLYHQAFCCCMVNQVWHNLRQGTGMQTGEQALLRLAPLEQQAVITVKHAKERQQHA
jgi:hypothetical protein